MVSILQSLSKTVHLSLVLAIVLFLGLFFSDGGYGAFDQIEGKLKTDPIKVFHDAIDNVMPSVEVRSRRVGGATYQVPVEVRSERRKALAIRWIIAAARSRSEDTMGEKLSSELIDASNNRGNSVKKREDTHKMAEANRAFSHYRW